MINLAIFASGNGSNAENIIRYFLKSEWIRVALILSNREDAFVHTRAQALGVPSRSFRKVEFEEGKPVLDALQAYSVDFIVLAGFLLKVSQPILEGYPDRILNIHPALLPKHGGKGMYGDRVHQVVVNAGDTESGITIHYVNEHYDEGTILFQARCKVLPTDSVDDVAQKVHELEYLHFPKVIEEAVLKAFPLRDRGGD
jgi:phosphoribosylglycinamide formyltransferase-1